MADHERTDLLVQITPRITPALKEDMETAAERLGISATEFVRLALRAALDGITLKEALDLRNRWR